MFENKKSSILSLLNSLEKVKTENHATRNEATHVTLFIKNGDVMEVAKQETRVLDH